MTPYVLAVLMWAPPSPTPTVSAPPQGGDLVGCYSIQLGRWEPPQNLGQDVMIVTPPAALELTREPAQAPFRGYFAARPAPGQAPSILEFGFWRHAARGEVEVVLSTGFSGLTIEARPTAVGFIGTAKTFWDFPRTSQTAQFTAKRIQCKPQSDMHLEAPQNNALQLTKRAGPFEGALRAPSSSSRASQLSAVFCGPIER